MNDHPKQRKPCFIDKDGTICAVGYLVQQTAGQQMAEEINSLFKYSEVYEMDISVLEDWVASSGLTLEEVATIQPKYGPPQDYSYIEPEYALASSILGGINVAASTINVMHGINSDRSNFVPYVGLVSGAATAGMGFSALQYRAGNRNVSRNSLSMLNIGLGTSTMFISAYRLFKKKTSEPRLASLNVYSYPAVGDRTGIGLAITKRF